MLNGHRCTSSAYYLNFLVRTDQDAGVDLSLR